MKRRDFLLTGRLPALFIGHGSPMNIVEKNRFTENMAKIAASIPRPKAILCVSAHWETNGTKVLAADRPRQIFDFFGFPQELYEVSYKPEGAKAVAESVVPLVAGRGHNLRAIDWNPDAPPQPWAVRFDGMVCDVLQGEGDRLQQVGKIFSDKEISAAHPSLDHLLPLVYAAGAGSEGGEAEIVSLGIQNGSVSMTSLAFT